MLLDKTGFTIRTVTPFVLKVSQSFLSVIVRSTELGYVFLKASSSTLIALVVLGHVVENVLRQRLPVGGLRPFLMRVEAERSSFGSVTLTLFVIAVGNTATSLKFAQLGFQSVSRHLGLQGASLGLMQLLA